MKADRDNNTVTLVEDLFSESLMARDVNLISISKLDAPMEVTVKTRYKQPETKATIYPGENDNIRVVFENPQRAITPGQAVVFYDNDVVVGGGTISF